MGPTVFFVFLVNLYYGLVYCGHEKIHILIDIAPW